MCLQDHVFPLAIEVPARSSSDPEVRAVQLLQMMLPRCCISIDIGSMHASSAAGGSAGTAEPQTQSHAQLQRRVLETVAVSVVQNITTRARGHHFDPIRRIILHTDQVRCDGALQLVDRRDGIEGVDE